MAHELTPQRRQQLAAGLLRIFGAMLALRGIVLTWLVIGKGTDMAGVVIASHLLISIAGFLIAWMCTKRPRIGAVGVLAVLAMFLLLALPNHPICFFEAPWMGIVALAQWLMAMMVLLALAIQLGSLRKADVSRSRWSGLVAAFIAIGLTLGVTEVALRQIGLVPGMLAHHPRLPVVDSLVDYANAAADSDGIYAYTQVMAARMRWRIQYPALLQGEWREKIDAKEADLLEDELQLAQGKLQNAYTAFLHRIELVPDSLRDPVDAAYLAQGTNPINLHGFRSIPFECHITQKRKVLLLGDSFTWGHSASHFSNCFAELLAARGYAIYNSGISGADPPQYLAIAQKYIPIIHPDVVVVNLYLGNDIFDFERPLEPLHALQYRTNAGTFLAYPGPEWLPSADSAYAFIDAEQRIPATDSLAFNKFCSFSVLGTMLWQSLSALNIVHFARPNRGYWQRCASAMQTQPVTRKYLLAIRDVCTRAHVQFLLAIIPSFDIASPQFGQCKDMFEGFSPLLPSKIGLEDYTMPTGHFNDAGHFKYAEMLAEALQDHSQSTCKKPKILRVQ